MISPCLLLGLLAQSAAAAAPSKKAETLWHEWYLVTRNGKGISFFEETAERRPEDRQIAVTQKWVEKIGPRSEIYIGSVAAADSLAPVAFFVERKGRKPYKTDARAKDGSLVVTFKPAGEALAKTTESTPLLDHMYFSGFLPMAVARHFKDGKGAFAFTAVVEDAGEMNVEVKGGSAEITAKTRKLGREHCRQVLLQWDGGMQEWWISQEGKVCRVDAPEAGTHVELSNEKAARKALKEGY